MAVELTPCLQQLREAPRFFCSSLLLTAISDRHPLHFSDLILTLKMDEFQDMAA